MTDIAYLSATEALQRFRDRTLSPVELFDAVQARATETEPAVKSLVHLDFDRARAAARDAERRYGGTGPAPRPLEGLTVAIKEDEPIEGQPWTQGSLILKDEIAQHTGDVPRRVIEAGGIVHARTTSPELGAAAFTRSRIWGVTRNPWNLSVAAGGSSGGSGAALAAGVTTLATGSDVGGSIRVPASLNGVVGYKPPFGRVPLDPPYNYDTWLHSGPMARTVADTILLQNVLAGPSDRDLYSLRPKYVLPDSFEDVRGVRIGLSIDLESYAVDEDVRRNTLALADGLRSAGAVVEEVHLDLNREMVQRASAINYTVFGGSMLREWARNELVAAYIPVMVERFAEYGKGGTVAELHDIQTEMHNRTMAVLERYDVILHPTMASRGISADSDYLGDDTYSIAHETHTDPMFAQMTLQWNLMSQHPVLSVPSGLADNGVPTGVQIIGPTYTDEIVFRVALACEQVFSLFRTVEQRPRLLADT